MRSIERRDTKRLIAGVVEVVAAIGIATALVALLEQGLRIPNASSVYLLAVAAIAIRLGTSAALGTAVGAFLVYNFAFIEPRVTFAVARPEELLTLLLLLFIGVVIGRLAGGQRDREREAVRRERASRALFAISRELATAHRLADAVRAVLDRVAAETGFLRLWVGVGPTVSQERAVADTDVDAPLPAIGTHFVLRRDSDEGAAAWTRILPPSTTAKPASRRGRSLQRVELRAADETIGSLWAEGATTGEPGLDETRLLAAVADQVAQAVRRERLATAAAEAEIDRRSDELRSALLDSISHDLRTPLASIRAAAGSIADPEVGRIGRGATGDGALDRCRGDAPERARGRRSRHEPHPGRRARGRRRDHSPRRARSARHAPTP